MICAVYQVPLADGRVSTRLNRAPTIGALRRHAFCPLSRRSG